MIAIDNKIFSITKYPDGSQNIKFNVMIDCNNNNRITLDNESNNFYFNKVVTILWQYESDEELFTLACTVDYLRRNGVKDIKLRIPYLINSRMDRIHNSNENFSLKVFSNFINSLGFSEVLTLNIHSNVSLALINNIKDEIPINDINESIKRFGATMIFFPDEGARKRYCDFKFNIPIAFGIKLRDWNSGNILGLKVIGDNIEGNKILIVDDICSRGNSFLYSSKELKNKGAVNVALYVTHCENTVAEGELLKNNNIIDKIYTTHTICTLDNDKIEYINHENIFNLNNFKGVF